MVGNRLIGREFNIVKTKLRRRSDHKVSVRLTDGFGSTFTKSKKYQSDENGTLRLQQRDFQELISNAVPNVKTAFLIPEFQNYNFSVRIIDDVTDYNIVSGVG